MIWLHLILGIWGFIIVYNGLKKEVDNRKEIALHSSISTVNFMCILLLIK